MVNWPHLILSIQQIILQKKTDFQIFSLGNVTLTVKILQEMNAGKSKQTVPQNFPRRQVIWTY